MEALPIFLLASALPLVIGAVFVGLLRRRDRRLPEEAGRQLVHEEHGGARIDGMNATMPLARISLYTDLLVVSSVRRVAIPLEALTGVEARRAVVSRGVFLELPTSYPEVILWSTQPQRLAELIEQQRRT